MWLCRLFRSIRDSRYRPSQSIDQSKRKQPQMKFSFRYVIALIILSLASASAQVVTGAQPFGTFGGGPFDSVNLGNLNVHFAIPVLHKAGRGLPFIYDLSYDS